MSNNSVVNQLTHIHNKQPLLVMSAAQKFSLASSNHSDISHYYCFEAGNTKQQPFAIPDGYIDVLFDCDKGNPTAEVFGTPLEAIDIQLTCKHKYFGIRFNPGVMPDFMNISASELINNHYHLTELIPDANQLVEQVTSSVSFTGKIGLFSQFMHKKSSRQHSCVTEEILKNIKQHKGNIKIKDLEDLTGYTIRTLQRKFQGDLGLSPKTYSRIVRCQSAVYSINHNDKVTFSDLAYDLGFTDQPHFLREFKKLVSTTPLSYQNKVKDASYLKKIEYI